jgi:hypothetical protein
MIPPISRGGKAARIPAFEAVSGEAALSGNNLTRPKFDEHSLIFDKRRLIFRNSADCFTVKIHPV